MDLRRADLGLLISLDALIAERSVTRAANRLGISQPALSAQLARLRDMFDDPLLVVSGKKMLPTARAEEIQGPLHALLDEMQALVRERQAFDSATASRTFRIAATDYVHDVLSLTFVSHVSRVAPSIRIALLAFDAKRARQLLERDEADLLVVSERLTPKGATAQKLFDETFVLVQRKGHPRGRGPVDLDGFCALSHLLISPEGGGFFGVADEELSGLGRKRYVATSVPSFLLAPHLIPSTDYVAVIPQRLARAFRAQLDEFPLPMQIQGFPIFASWHPRHERDPGHRWLRNTMISVAAGLR